MSELLWLDLVGIGAAIAAGWLAGLLGSGGAIVIVPVLYEIFRAYGVTDNVRAQLSAGTSLAVVAPTAMFAQAAHRRLRLSRPRAQFGLIGPVAAGVLVGCSIAAAAPASVFKVAYVGALLSLVGAKQLFQFLAISSRTIMPSWRLTAMLGLFTGLLGALTGTGGEPLTTILTMKGQQPIYQLVTSATRVVALIAASGTIGYMLAGLSARSVVPPFSVGFVSPIVATVMVPFIAVAASQGAKVGRSIPEGKKDLAFGLFALMVSVRMLADV
jgi:uncharacterized protein